LVEPDIMRDKLFHVFKFRGVNDPKVHKDENDFRLLANYTSCFLSLADTLRKAKNYPEAIQVAQRVSELLPYDWRPYAYLLQVYAEQEQGGEQIQKVLRQAEEVAQSSPGLLEDDFLEKLYFNLGYTYRQLGKSQNAVVEMKKVLTMNKKFRPAFEAIVSIYYAQKDQSGLIQTLENWVANNPEDVQTAAMLNQVKSPDFKFMEKTK